MNLFHIAWVSKSRAPVTNELLDSLQKVASRNNTAVGITGLLLTSHERFMEYLEGDATALASLFATICKDDRHQNVRCILFGPATTRLYPNWGLGVYDFDSDDVGDHLQELHGILDKHETVSYDDIVEAFVVFGSHARGTTQPTILDCQSFGVRLSANARTAAHPQWPRPGKRTRPPA